MSEKKLQTSKKRLSNGKWSYRNYVLLKDNGWTVEENDKLNDEQSKKVMAIESQKTIKDVCLKIDEILGDLPESARKTTTRKKKPLTEEQSNEIIQKARKIAYDVRWELEEKLQEKSNDSEQNGKLAIPLGQGKASGKNGFIISWNKTFDIMNNIIEKVKSDNKNAVFNLKEKDNKTKLEIKINQEE